MQLHSETVSAPDRLMVQPGYIGCMHARPLCGTFELDQVCRNVQLCTVVRWTGTVVPLYLLSIALGPIADIECTGLTRRTDVSISRWQACQCRPVQCLQLLDGLHWFSLNMGAAANLAENFSNGQEHSSLLSCND
jgi:hypothetical protein